MSEFTMIYAAIVAVAAAAAGFISFTGLFAMHNDRKALQARVDVLTEALEMVRDADNDCHKDGLKTIPQLARAKIDKALKIKT